jgi:hypothetical protein
LGAPAFRVLDNGADMAAQSLPAHLLDLVGRRQRPSVVLAVHHLWLKAGEYDLPA